MGSSTITELVEFTGGMNTLLSPHLIARNEAVSLINSDIRYGSLKSIVNLDNVSSLDDGPYFYQFNRVVYSFSSFRNNVLWDGKWYWSDSVGNTGKMLANGTELDLGIAAPTVALTQSLSGSAGTGVHEGDFKYTYTFYSIDTGAESAPAPLPLYLTADGQNIQLTGFQSLPAEATHYRLYRVGGYLPVFTLVERFTTTSYIDALDDTKVDGRLLYTLRNGVPPAGLTNLIELNGRFYGSVGNKIYFSALGIPDSWYVSDFITVKGKIIGLAAVPAGLLVLGQFSTSLLYGTDPVNFRLKLISDQYGCLGPESIAYLGDSVIWLSNKQVVMSDGYKIINVTSFKVDRVKGIIPTGAEVENETYYLSFKPGLFPEDTLYPSDGLYPDSVLGTTGVDIGIMALDFKRGNNFSYKIVSHDDINTIGIVDSNLHVSTGNATGTQIGCDDVMYQDCLSFTNCSPYELNVMNIDNGQNQARLTYLSPQFIDSGYSILKQYDKVRIRYKGDFNIKIYITEDEVLIDRAITSDVEVTELFGIPNNDNLGYFIQFKIVGIGIIESVQYSWKNREMIN